MSNSALAHLTATYTDSENEDDHNNMDDSPESSSDSQVIIPPQSIKKTIPPESPDKLAKKRRLVSYHDETMISDDEEEENRVPRLIKNIVTLKETEEDTNDDSDLSTQNSNKILSTDNIEKAKLAHYGFSLPPEVKGKPNPELIDKIKNFYEKMRTNNMDMNKIIQERKEFRNPSIYEKLIQFCDINEFGTNYPPESYDPLQWGPESFYEKLSETQKNEMLKRQKERKDLDKVEQATAAARKVEEDAKKRKSKWDQPAPATALTTQVTGTKGTVLSAFGSLPKKTTG